MNRPVHRLLGASNDAQNPNICTVCQNLFSGCRVDKELGVTATAVLGQDFRQLEESMRSGCQLCQLRWNQLTPEERVELKECRKVTYGFWKSRVGDGVAFEYWLDEKFGGIKPSFTKSVLIKAKAGMHDQML
jgi:hypothetical protein